MAIIVDTKVHFPCSWCAMSSRNYILNLLLFVDPTYLLRFTVKVLHKHMDVRDSSMSTCFLLVFKIYWWMQICLMW
jgi:hypothetical protein